MKINSREKLLFLLLVVFSLLLVGKSLMEGYKLTEDISESEKAFYEWVMNKQEATYKGGQYKSGVLSIKLIAINEREKDDVVYYVAKSRKYLLKVIPFSDVYIKEEKDKFLEE